MFGLSVTRIYTMTLTLVMLSGCLKQVDVKEVYSPDNTYVLITEIDESGGAAVPDITSVYLRLSTAPPEDKQLIFEGSAMSHFAAVWRGNDVMQLLYARGYVTTCLGKGSTPSLAAITVLGCK